MAIYKKNYITQAVLELSFNQISTQKFITFLGENTEKNGFGHIWNQQEVRHDDIQISDESFSRKVNKGIIWICDDTDGKKIQVTSNTLTIVFDGKYKSQEIITKEFEFISEFFKFFQIEYINRFLVRYINEFKAKDFPEVNGGDWSKFLNNELLHNVKIAKDIGDIRRTLCESTISIDDYFLGLKYGIWNRYAPNPIVDWDFIIDIAIKSSTLIEINETHIKDLFNEYKDSLNRTFEYCITDEMRKILTPTNNENAGN